MGVGNKYFSDRFLSQPFAWRHAGDGLEAAEEGALAGEARRFYQGRQFYVGLLAEQLLGVVHAIFGHELGKGAVALAADAVGQGGDADAKLDSDVRQSEALCEVALVALYDLA